MHPGHRSADGTSWRAMQRNHAVGSCILIGVLQQLGSLSTFESIKGASFVSVFVVLLVVLLVRPQGLFVRNA